MGTERITRCPHCGTVFRLWSAQLHSAWLRCAQCHQPFDVTGRVLTWQPEDSRGYTLSTERLHIEGLLRTATPDVRRGPPDAHHPVAASSPSDEVLAFEQALASFPRPKHPWPEALHNPEGLVSDDEPVQAPVRQRWGAVWAVALLGLLLIAQLWWATRALWVVNGPGQAMLALCERVACVLPPWRESRMLVLTHARLLRTESGHALYWELENAAHWPLVTPSMELTLLDAQEQVLVRRVLSPDEGQMPRVLNARQHASGAAAWSWHADEQVAVYRLLAFYP